MGKRPITRRFTNNQSELNGSKRRDIGLRPPAAVATTTAYLYGVGLFVSRGVVPVLNITSAEMCASYADREKEDRERQRR